MTAHVAGVALALVTVIVLVALTGLVRTVRGTSATRVRHRSVVLALAVTALLTYAGHVAVDERSPWLALGLLTAASLTLIEAVVLGVRLWRRTAAAAGRHEVSPGGETR